MIYKLTTQKQTQLGEIRITYKTILRAEKLNHKDFSKPPYSLYFCDRFFLIKLRFPALFSHLYIWHTLCSDSAYVWHVLHTVNLTKQHYITLFFITYSVSRSCEILGFIFVCYFILLCFLLSENFFPPHFFCRRKRIEFQVTIFQSSLD